MPSNIPVPAVPDYLEAYADALNADGDQRADARRGSGYDLIGGPAAIIWSRESQHDDDVFNAIYFDSAKGSDLDNYVLKHFSIERIQDTRGQGYVSLNRPNSGGGGGRFWTGTRISVLFPVGGIRQYRVASDTDIGATQTSALVPIEAVDYGSGTAVDTRTGAYVIRVEDAIWDPSWVARSVVCENGTDYEAEAAFKSRVKSSLRANLPGLSSTIVAACQTAGASNVAFFESNYPGDAFDHGQNIVYVSDAGFTAPNSLIVACRTALESVRVLGDQLDVRPMVNGGLVPFNLTVTLWDNPAKFNLVDLQNIVVGTVTQYFAGASSGFQIHLGELDAAIRRASGSIQSVTFNTPTSDTTILVGVRFPAVLNRYSVASTQVAVTFVGPS